MPRVAVNKYRYIVNDLYAYLIGQMKVKGYTQERLGEELGLTQQVISSKLRKQQLTTLELIQVIDILDLDVTRIIGGRK